jgi:hypothetical protein
MHAQKFLLGSIACSCIALPQMPHQANLTIFMAKPAQSSPLPSPRPSEEKGTPLSQYLTAIPADFEKSFPHVITTHSSNLPVRSEGESADTTIQRQNSSTSASLAPDKADTPLIQKMRNDSFPPSIFRNMGLQPISESVDDVPQSSTTCDTTSASRLYLEADASQSRQYSESSLRPSEYSGRLHSVLSIQESLSSPKSRSFITPSDLEGAKANSHIDALNATVLIRIESEEPNLFIHIDPSAAIVACDSYNPIEKDEILVGLGHKLRIVHQFKDGNLIAC